MLEGDSFLILLFAYALFIVLIGIVPGRIGGREGFLLSERKLNSFSSGFTIAASKIGAGALITFSALAFRFGMGALWLFASYILGYGLFYAFAQRIHAESRQHQYYTMADYFGHRYGQRIGTIMGAASCLSLSGWILTNFIAGGKLISLLTGWPVSLAITLMAATILMYLLVGGFHAVVRTDIVQYICLILIIIVLAVALREAPPAPPATSAPMPVSQILSLVAFGLLFPMGSAELWQRVYATATKKTLRRALIIASASFLIIGPSILYICLRVRPHTGNVVEELALTHGVLGLVPPALGLVWTVGFTAALLSAADTFVFGTSAALVQDVLQRNRLVSAAKVLGTMRMTMIGLASVGVVVAIALGDVLNVTFLFAGVTLAMGVVALSTWLLPKVREQTLIVGVVAGVALCFVQGLAGGITVVTTAVGALGAVVSMAVYGLYTRLAKTHVG